MPKGFVLRAVLGVLFAAALFATAVIVHAADRETPCPSPTAQPAEYETMHA